MSIQNGMIHSASAPPGLGQKPMIDTRASSEQPPWAGSPATQASSAPATETLGKSGESQHPVQDALTTLRQRKWLIAFTAVLMVAVTLLIALASVDMPPARGPDRRAPTPTAVTQAVAPMGEARIETESSTSPASAEGLNTRHIRSLPPTNTTKAKPHGTRAHHHSVPRPSSQVIEAWPPAQVRLDRIYPPDAASLSNDDRESRLRSLLQLLPSSAELHAALGSLLARRGDWPEASQAFRQAIEHAPLNAAYHGALAASLEHLRQPAKAAAHYRRALELSDDNAGSLDRTRIEQRLHSLEEPAAAS